MLPTVDFERRLASLEAQLASLITVSRADQNTSTDSSPTFAAISVGAVVTSWVPQLWQGANRTSTVTFARYYVIGKYAFVQVKLVCTAAGSAGNAVAITNIPAAIAPVNFGAYVACGSGVIRRAGITNYACTLLAASATEFDFVTGTNNDVVGVLPSFALANTDLITLDGVYEIA